MLPSVQLSPSPPTCPWHVHLLLLYTLRAAASLTLLSPPYLVTMFCLYLLQTLIMSLSFHCHLEFQTKTPNAYIVSLLSGHPFSIFQCPFLPRETGASTSTVCPDRAKELVSLNSGLNRMVPSTALQPGHFEPSEKSKASDGKRSGAKGAVLPLAVEKAVCGL